MAYHKFGGRKSGVRFIHSSDLQIGKVFGFFEPEIAAVLQDARQAVVVTLGKLAEENGVSAVLLAGDIYDKQQLSQATLVKPIEAMRRFPKVTWHLMPGNHDCVRENGLWDRLSRSNLPDNIVLHLKPGAFQLTDDARRPAFLLPAPLKHIASVDDLTNYMDGEATPDGAIRIGMAHGSIQGFGSEGDASNYVSPLRPNEAGLAYLAMGDWHRQMRISDRVWYSGTPEPDQFKLPPDATSTLCNGGTALLVEVGGPAAVPLVTPIQTGRHQWHQVSRTLTEVGQIGILEAELRAIAPDISNAVIDLRVEGVLSLGARKEFEEKISNSVCAAFCGLRFTDSNLVLEPTETDLDEIDRAGFVRTAAERLNVMANDMSDPARARIAGLALKRLYLEHLREGGAR
jgi:hypothetical protein